MKAVKIITAALLVLALSEITSTLLAPQFSSTALAQPQRPIPPRPTPTPRRADVNLPVPGAAPRAGMPSPRGGPTTLITTPRPTPPVRPSATGGPPQTPGPRTFIQPGNPVSSSSSLPRPASSPQSPSAATLPPIRTSAPRNSGLPMAAPRNSPQRTTEPVTASTRLLPASGFSGTARGSSSTHLTNQPTTKLPAARSITPGAGLPPAHRAATQPTTTRISPKSIPPLNLNHITLQRGYYRAGNSFAPKPSDYKLRDGKVSAEGTKGVSLDANSAGLKRRMPHQTIVKVTYIPPELRLRQQGRDSHAVIQPRKDMSLETFTAALNRIETVAVTP